MDFPWFSQSSGYWVYVLWLIHIKIPWLGPAVHIKKHSSPSAPQLCQLCRSFSMIILQEPGRIAWDVQDFTRNNSWVLAMFSPQKSRKIIKKSSKFGNDENHDGMLWVFFGGRDQQQGHAWHLLHPGYRWYIPLGHDAMREVGPWDMLNDLQLPTGPPSATTPSGWWFTNHLEKWWSESQWEGWHPIWNGK